MLLTPGKRHQTLFIYYLFIFIYFLVYVFFLIFKRNTSLYATVTFSQYYLIVKGNLAFQTCDLTAFLRCNYTYCTFFPFFSSSSGSILEYYVYQQNDVFALNKVAKFSVECSFTTILSKIHRAELEH